MRTNVVLDDELIEEAKKISGLQTKKEVIHQALKIFIKYHQRKPLTDLEGKIEFQDDYHKEYKKLRK